MCVFVSVCKLFREREDGRQRDRQTKRKAIKSKKGREGGRKEREREGRGEQLDTQADRQRLRS